MTQDQTPDPQRPIEAIRAAHHQIGNSLQSVASLLRLESRSAPPAAASILSDAGRRVRTVMHLHQRLQEDGADRVRLDDLLGDICRDVAELDARDRDAEIHLDAHPMITDARTASALAMIAAEWLGNALEHGLAEKPGRVDVELVPTDGGARLRVSDDGVGDRGGSWKIGFGTVLVQRLCAQIRATATQSVGGTGSCLELMCPGIVSDPGP